MLLLVVVILSFWDWMDLSILLFQLVVLFSPLMLSEVIVSLTVAINVNVNVRTVQQLGLVLSYANLQWMQ